MYQPRSSPLLVHSDGSVHNFIQGLENGVRGYWSIAVTTRECPRNFWDWVSQITFTFVHNGKLTISVA